MARSNKRYASCTWGDLHLFVAQLRAEHDLVAVFVTENVAAQRGLFRTTVKLYEGRVWSEERGPIKVASGPMDIKPDSQAGLIMHLLNSAYVQYTDDPWNWTLRDRKRETQ